ncbi:nickel-responsive transcriptional regulator NikR [Kaistia dalseonensis]|uniref:Putative nickel-responsive regulator n=1 Tax=Kaistia dalseonensis TaxID=410840 RepID=A0ABU0H9K6_9HYPH|nr:nickel-responsive transcriptional regulator NikR [Kaistia dalseonensis]MCX5495844.1 nickel-responsive transcriptional regulator NikR [Kaistia dalseonensis]MDQ0438445.1 CopG family nickel-responsive transcriptional regulator [Kaistia dalseonensis]
MQRVTVTLDDELMVELDRIIAARGYQNRSEAIRDLARAGLKLAALETGSAQNCVAVLSYVYDHDARDLARRLTTTFHDHHELTVSSLHVHLDRDNCLEIGVLKGPTAAVQHFAEHVIAERAVRHGSLHLIPAADDTPPHAHAPHADHTHD